MFSFDIRIFSYIYSNCCQIGNIFGYDAFEGSIMYSGLISIGLLKLLETARKLKNDLFFILLIYMFIVRMHVESY
jgi:hypothetical protein